jgi:hypothetical protein
MAGLWSSDNYPKAPSNGQILISFGHSRFSYSYSLIPDPKGDKRGLLKTGFRIRIRIGSGFNRASGSGSGFGIWIRIQEGKNDPQK